MLLATTTYLNAEQNCKNLPGFKKIGKSTGEYLKCLESKVKKNKLNTDSKLTDWISGKEKIELPSVMKGLKNVGKALKPSPLSK